MRLFLAIFPPKEYTRYFAEVYRKFDKQKRNLKPTPYDQVHLTLKFIGANVSEYSRDEIINIFKKFEGQYSKPLIKIDNIQFGFERQRDPRYLIANIAENDGLQNLSDEVHKLIKSLKLRDTIRWKSKFSNDFHITLARLKPSSTKSTGRIITKLVEDTKPIPLPEPFIPESFELMESVIRADGPVYQKLVTFKI